MSKVATAGPPDDWLERALSSLTPSEKKSARLFFGVLPPNPEKEVDDGEVHV